MSLVSYASSSPSASDASGSSAGTPPAAKRRRRSSPPPPPPPPPPLAFSTLYTTTPRASTVDDPSLHDGRARAAPHVPGAWPSHAYIDWQPTRAAAARLAALVADAPGPPGSGPARPVHALLRTPLGAPAPLHVSLSAPLLLTGAQRASWVAEVRTRVRHAAVRPFVAPLAAPRWVRNEAGTRWFWVAPLRPTRSMAALLRACNEAAAAEALPGLYVDADEAVARREERRITGDRGVRAAAEQAEAVAAEAEAEAESEVEAEIETDAVGEPYEPALRCHVSLAWALADGDDTDGIPTFPAAVPAIETPGRWDDALDGLTVPVTAVLVKVGNVVTEIPLAGPQLNSAREDGVAASAMSRSWLGSRHD